MIQASHKTRLFTAAVGLTVVGAALLTGGPALFALVLAVALAGLWEFFALAPGTGGLARGLGLGFGAALLSLAWYFGPMGALAVLLAAFWAEEIIRLALPQADLGPRWAIMAGLAYVPATLQFLLQFGPTGTAVILAAVMATDTGAYYSGHLIGGPKVWPSVSPKKTWAGCAGGLGSALLVCLVIGHFTGQASLGSWLGLGACLSLGAQMGDFLESSFKRTAGIKDSGTILPGHGGILDRIDGLLPAILIYALAKTLVPFP
jgi:phosphatidate cytidylyltransferase